MKPLVRWALCDDGDIDDMWFAVVKLTPLIAAMTLRVDEKDFCWLSHHATAEGVAQFTEPGFYFGDDLEWPDKYAVWRRWGRFKTADAAKAKFEKWWAARQPAVIRVERNDIIKIHKVDAQDFCLEGEIWTPDLADGHAPIYCVHRRNRPRK